MSAEILKRHADRIERDRISRKEWVRAIRENFQLTDSFLMETKELFGHCRIVSFSPCGPLPGKDYPATMGSHNVLSKKSKGGKNG